MASGFLAWFGGGGKCANKTFPPSGNRLVLRHEPGRELSCLKSCFLLSCKFSTYLYFFVCFISLSYFVGYYIFTISSLLPSFCFNFLVLLCFITLSLLCPSKCLTFWISPANSLKQHILTLYNPSNHRLCKRFTSIPLVGFFLKCFILSSTP